MTPKRAWRAAALVVVACSLTSCSTPVAPRSLGLTIRPDGRVELWFPQCSVAVGSVSVDLTHGEGGRTLWGIEGRTALPNLPYRTILGSVPRGYRATVRLARPLLAGVDYVLTIGSGEAWGQQVTFRLADLRPGFVWDFAGHLQTAAQFVRQTSCPKGQFGVSPPA